MSGVKELQPREVPSSYQTVSLRDLMADFPTARNYPEIRSRFPDSDSLYAAIAPIIAYADTFWQGKLKVRGSIARHAAIRTHRESMFENDATAPFVVLDEQQRQNFRPTDHYRALNVLQNHLETRTSTIRAIEDRSPQVIKTLHQLLAGPDFDFKVPQETDSSHPDHLSKHEKFAASLHAFVLPAVAEKIATGNFKTDASTTIQNTTALAEKLRDTNITRDTVFPSYIPQTDKVDILTDMPVGWKFAARVDTPSQPLVIYVEKVKVRDAIGITRVVFGTDVRNDPQQKLTGDTILPLAQLDFIDTLPAEKATFIDTRSGTTATTYDDAHADVIVDHSDANISIGIPEKIQTIYNNHIDLGPDWEKRNPADALEIATRVLWQAIDAEAQGWVTDKDRLIVKDETQERIANHLDKLYQQDPSVWDNLSDFHKKSIQINLLNSIIISPQRVAEYFKRAEILKILWRKYPQLGPWPPHILSAMVRRGFKWHLNYQQDIVGISEPDKEAFVPGWEIFDAACNLNNVFPDLETPLERVHEFTML
jgi:hypothetical protein